MNTQHRRFTREFKQEAAALVVQSGRSANQVAKELGLSQTALSRSLREATLPASSPDCKPLRNSRPYAVRSSGSGWNGTS